MYLECILNSNLVRTYIKDGELIVDSQYKTVIYGEKKLNQPI